MKRMTLIFLFALAAVIAGCQRTTPPPAEAAASAPPPVTSESAEDSPAQTTPAVPADIEKAPRRPRPPTASSKPSEKPMREPDAEGDDASGDDARVDDAGADDGLLDRPDFDDDIDEDAPPPPPARRISWRPQWDGLGDIELGMDFDAVMDDYPGQFDDPSDSAGDGCFYLQARGGSTQPALMFEEGRLVRYDVDSPRFVAPGGGRVGMDADEIVDRYEGDVERHPHKYSDGEYLRIEHPGGDSVLLFETDEDGVVTEWRIGLAPAVDYVEGCS